MGKRKAYLVAGLGLEMLLSPVIGLLGGQFLDEKFGTAPYIMTAGIVLGFLAGIRVGVRIYRIGMKAMNEKSGGEGGSS